MKCTRCKIDYPVDCIGDALIDGDYVQLCGQCALEETNAAHGLSRKKFDGDMAEAIRQRTLRHREKMKNRQAPHV